MPQITFNITTDEMLGRIVEAYCANFGYQSEINGAPNTETRAQFTRRKIRETIKDQVIQYESRKAFETKAREANDALVAAGQAAENEIQIS